MTTAATVITTIAQLLLATLVARHGLRELGIQRPFNKTFVIALALLAVGIYLGPTNAGFWGTAAAVIWFFIQRYLLLPGTVDHNVAVARSSYWAQKYYRPGVVLHQEGSELRDFAPAQDAVRRFKSAIQEQSRAEPTPFGQCRIATVYQELGFLLRMQNEFDEAERAFQTALVVLPSATENPETPSESVRALTLLRLAELHHLRGDDRASREFNESRSIYAELGDRDSVTLVDAMMAALYPKLSPTGIEP